MGGGGGGLDFEVRLMVSFNAQGCQGKMPGPHLKPPGHFKPWDPHLWPPTLDLSPLCDIPSRCCFCTEPWTFTRSSRRLLRRVNAF